MNMDSSRILAIINDQTLGLSTPPSAAAKSTRIGARAILFDGNSRVALVYEHRYHHYKLPGGNVEPGENLEQAVRREIKEEVGANIADIRYLGVVHSYLSAYNEDCDQHYFTARVDGARLFGATISSKLSSEFNPVHPRNTYICLSERES